MIRLIVNDPISLTNSQKQIAKNQKIQKENQSFKGESHFTENKSRHLASIGQNKDDNVQKFWTIADEIQSYFKRWVDLSREMQLCGQHIKFVNENIQNLKNSKEAMGSLSFDICENILFRATQVISTEWGTDQYKEYLKKLHELDIFLCRLADRFELKNDMGHCGYLYKFIKQINDKKLIEEISSEYINLCENGLGLACQSAGNYVVAMGYADVARNFFEKSCEMNHRSCIDLIDNGYVHFQSDRGIEILNLACKNGDINYCSILVDYNLSNELVKRELIRHCLQRNRKDSCRVLLSRFQLSKDLQAKIFKIFCQSGESINNCGYLFKLEKELLGINAAIDHQIDICDQYLGNIPENFEDLSNWHIVSNGTVYSSGSIEAYSRYCRRLMN